MISAKAGTLSLFWLWYKYAEADPAIEIMVSISAVKLAAQGGFHWLLGDDFKLAWNELKRSRGACKATDEALVVHWRQEHPGFAGKGFKRASTTGIG
jgi:hypothetical protein